MDTGARYQAVVVGASLGGIEALQTILGDGWTPSGPEP